MCAGWGVIFYINFINSVSIVKTATADRTCRMQLESKANG